MTNTTLLRKRIEDSGLKLQFIADKMGISRFALLQKIENRTEFRVSEVAALCILLDIKTMTEKERIFFAKEVE
jgi:hypothetical protein